MNEQTSDPSPAAAPAPAPAAAEPAVLAGPVPVEQQLGCVLAHLFGLNIVTSLVYWFLTKDDHDRPFVQDQAKEALNLQINVLIAFFVCMLLAFIIIGAILLPLLMIAVVILVIMAVVKASKGEVHRHPYIIRLIK